MKTKTKLILFILITTLSLFLSGCNYYSVSHEMVKGEILYFKNTKDGLKFSFTNKNGDVTDNINQKLNYKLQIDDSIKTPELYYEVYVEYEVNPNTGKKTIFIESHEIDNQTKIIIKVNKKNYEELLDESFSNSTYNAK